MGEIGRGQKQ